MEARLDARAEAIARKTAHYNVLKAKCVLRKSCEAKLYCKNVDFYISNTSWVGIKKRASARGTALGLRRKKKCALGSCWFYVPHITVCTLSHVYLNKVHFIKSNIKCVENTIQYLMLEPMWRATLKSKCQHGTMYGFTMFTTCMYILHVGTWNMLIFGVCTIHVYLFLRLGPATNQNF